MKKMVFIAGALMLIAGSATAGTNIAWNDCIGGGGTADRAVACTNAGTGIMYITFDPGASLPSVASSDAFIDVVTTNPIGTWWNPPTFGTRWGSAATEPISGLCPAWWAAALSGPIVFSPAGNLINPNRLRIRLTAIVAAGEEQPVAPGTEYFAGQLLLKFNAGTLGNAECNGGGAIGTYDLNLLQPGGVPDTHLGQTPLVSDCVTFKGGGGQVCPTATPTKKATWGSIKALYR